MMRVLISDSDSYVFAFERALEKHGGALVFTNYSRALGLVASETFDDIIFDVSKKTFVDAVDPYPVIKEIVASPWIDTHMLTVYTRTPRRQFETRSHELEIPLEKIAFYQKGGDDVPPCLQCISAAIRSDPSLIGIDATQRRLPKAITRRWIESQEHGLYTAILRTVSNWTADCPREEDVIDALPLSVRRIWMIGSMEGEIFNGGFSQFFGNLAGDDGTLDTSAYADALAAFGIDDGADLVRAAMKVWQPFREDTQTSATMACEIRRACESADSSEGEPDELDRRFFELRDSGLASRIDAYIRQHPNEFICRKKKNQ